MGIYLPAIIIIACIIPGPFMCTPKSLYQDFEDNSTPFKSRLIELVVVIQRMTQSGHYLDFKTWYYETVVLRFLF